MIILSDAAVFFLAPLFLLRIWALLCWRRLWNRHSLAASGREEQVKRYSRFRAIGVALMAAVALLVRPATQAQAPSGIEFQIAVDASAHQRFGLYYPVTYRFQIPAGSSGLTAQYTGSTRVMAGPPFRPGPLPSCSME